VENLVSLDCFGFGTLNVLYLAMTPQTFFGEILSEFKLLVKEKIQ